MIIYQVIILILLPMLLLLPNQEKGHLYLSSLISLTSLFLLPIFIKNFWQDILHKNIVTIFFVLFLIASAVSTIFSINQQKSAVELVLFVAYFIIFTSAKIIFSTYRSKQFLAFSLLICTVILSLISFYNTLILHYSNRQAEGTSFMWVYYGHNHLSAILVFAIPLAFYFFWINFKKMLFGPVFLYIICLLLLSLFFTLARGSIISLFTALFFGLFFLPGSVAKRSILAYFMGIVFIILALLFNVSQVTQNLAKDKTARLEISGQIDRPLYWNQAVENFITHPLWGTGLNSFAKVNSINLVPQDSIFLRTDFVHNFFLQMLSDAGFFGFLTSIGLIFAVLWRTGKTISNRIYVKSHEQLLFIAFYIGIFASIMNTLVDYDWQIPTVFLIFWLVGGLIVNPKT